MVTCPRCGRDTEPKPLVRKQKGYLGEPRFCVLPIGPVSRCDTDLVAQGVIDPPARPEPVVLEKHVQRAAIKWLEAQPDCAVWRTAATAFRDDDDNLVRSLEPGFADLTCGVAGWLLFVECKKPGEKQSAKQIKFQERAERRGVRYIVEDSLGLETLREAVAELRGRCADVDQLRELVAYYQQRVGEETEP